MLIENIKKQDGFTLVELAIVLVIVGVLLGGFIGTLASRIESTQRSNTQDQLENIKSALLGYASAEGRLPCPAIATSAGDEDPACGFSGFVPGKTLGLSGAYNRDNLLLDAWGNPIRYSVTTDNDFITAGGISVAGMGNVSPNLTVCSSVNADGDGCTLPLASNELITTAPFVLISLGKDGNEFVNDITGALTDQGENSGEIAVAKNATGENLDYTVGNDQIFVSKTYSSAGATAGQFDDIIVWVSPYILYSRMIEAGQLP